MNKSISHELNRVYDSDGDLLGAFLFLQPGEVVDAENTGKLTIEFET